MFWFCIDTNKLPIEFKLANFTCNLSKFMAYYTISEFIKTFDLRAVLPSLVWVHSVAPDSLWGIVFYVTVSTVVVVAINMFILHCVLSKAVKF